LHPPRVVASLGEEEVGRGVLVGNIGVVEYGGRSEG